MNIDLLFVGGLFPRECNNIIINNSKGLIQNAANNLQWNLIHGFDKNLESPVQIINAPFIGHFPKQYKKLIINNYSFKHNKKQNHYDLSIGFVNMIGISHLSKYYNMKFYLNKWMTNSSKRKKVSVGYSMTFPITKSLAYIKSKDPTITTCLIVTDIPSQMNSNHNQIRKLLKTKEIGMIKEHLKYIDCFVFMTEEMNDYFKLEKPYIVMEGIATDKFNNIPENSNKDYGDYIFYSGTLAKKYGVMDLIDAFKKLNTNGIRLLICGAGSEEEKIIEESKKNENIIFLGQIEHKQVLDLQRKALLLVNPRKNREIYVKYSFPSKTLEYLSSGTPMLGYRLDGIPDEYFNYIIEIPDSKNGMVEQLRGVLNTSRDKLIDRGIKGREFVMNNKNSHIQTLNILQLISKNSEDL